MYVDERKEFLSDIEKRAKNESEQQDEPKEGYREGLQRRLSHSLRPQALTHKYNRFTAMWVSLILSAGVIALLILFLFIA